MSENESFFRKVVRFVANPATDWTDLSSRQDDNRELELEKSELKAMIERKRRNDFVRKREFDTLRRVRREGLTPEQLAALGTSSRLDDSEPRASMTPTARPAGVKAKIDEIEQQMVGEGGISGRGRGPGPAVGSGMGSGMGAAPRSSPLQPPVAPAYGGGPARGAPAAAYGAGRGAAAQAAAGGMVVDDSLLPALPPLPPHRDDRSAYGPSGGYSGNSGHGGQSGQPYGPPSLTPVPSSSVYPPRPSTASYPTPAPSPARASRWPDLHLPAVAPAPVQMGNGLPPLAPLASVSFDGAGPGPRSPAAGPLPPGQSADPLAAGLGGAQPFATEASDVVHDPDLDEAVIAFANADFAPCEDSLRRITAPGAPREKHAETWLVLFDLYRATNQQQRFESLALDYAQQFGWSAPQWVSLPQLVADAAAHEAEHAMAVTAAHGSPSQMHAIEVGWVCPPHLDMQAVAQLRAQTLQLPLPWVLDWADLARVDPEAAMQLSTLFRLWSGQALDMRWLAGDRLFAVLQEAAPTGARSADPVFWLTRLDGLRLANRANQFDETAIDYCVTYEVSPPSWEPARCKVQITGEGSNTRTPHSYTGGGAGAGAPSSFLESRLIEDETGSVAHVELSGQLVGDIGATLAKIEATLATATVISVSCMRLIRVDFIAAGDLLNWVMARRQENRAVHLVDAHRLVALFFGAMGINEHAKVQVRKV
jgi:hypothetical protein